MVVVCCLVEKFFRDPNRYDHRGFQVKCVSRYGELIPMHKEGGAEEVHRSKGK